MTQTDSQSLCPAGDGPRDQRRRRLQKLTAKLGKGKSVITEGVDSTMEAYVEALGVLHRRALAAKRQGLQLPTFLAMLRDQAMHQD